MTMYFSASRLGFFDDIDRHIFDVGGGWPSDAVELTESGYGVAINVPTGMSISADGDGYPIHVPSLQPAYSTPAVCTPAQGLVALFALKRITEDDVLAAIGQIPDEVQQYTARIGYQRATVWERCSPTMQAMAQLLQLTEADLDELFSHAVKVQV